MTTSNAAVHPVITAIRYASTSLHFHISSQDDNLVCLHRLIGRPLSGYVHDRAGMNVPTPPITIFVC